MEHHSTLPRLEVFNFLGPIDPSIPRVQTPAALSLCAAGIGSFTGAGEGRVVPVPSPPHALGWSSRGSGLRTSIGAVPVGRRGAGTRFLRLPTSDQHPKNGAYPKQMVVDHRFRGTPISQLGPARNPWPYTQSVLLLLLALQEGELETAASATRTAQEGGRSAARFIPQG